MATRLMCAGALLLGLTAAAHAQPAVEQLSATMLIAGNGDTRRSTVPLIEERLQVAIDGQHATTTLTQVFQHRGGGPIEGRYRLRPGTGSHVAGFAYWNGEAKIVGEVFERQTAQKVYDRITQRRRDPGLLEEDGEGAFAFKVFPIQPGEHKRIELRWTRWLERRDHTVRYRAPITRPDAEIVVALTGKVSHLRSPSHRLHVENTANGLRVRGEGGRGTGELVLEWNIDDADWTPTAFVQPNGSDEGWFAVALAAPSAPAAAVAAKDVTIVIDRSGSMEGEPMDHAKAAAADMIRLLRDGDRVDVISFSDEVDPLFASPQPIDATSRARAIAYVDRLHAGGGTDIALALTTAIAAQDATQQVARPRVIVFMTDGQSDIEKALAAARTDTKDVRLFTLGLGTKVNKPLLQRLAASKRGRFVYIERAGSIEDEIGRLARSISSPLLVNVSIDVEGAQAMRLYPRTLPDVFAEDELLVTGRLRGTGKARFVIRGVLAGKPVAFATAVDLAAARDRPWVGALWAQARVDHLLEELSLGANQPELVAEVTDLALTYNFVTPYTAFLAVPESELGEMATTVTAARERKAKLIAAAPDTEVLRSSSGGLNAVAVSQASSAPTEVVGRDDSETVQLSSAAPEVPAHVRRRGACAGCASAGPGGTATLLFVLLAFAIVTLRRRR
jgi:Ca-activated chloride channel family protein